MKFLAIALLSLTSLTANAYVEVSNRHLAKIQHAVDVTCPALKGAELIELSNEIVVDRVDQGVRDYYFTTTYEAVSASQTAVLTIKSAIFDAYDHSDKDWGIIEITSLKGCN